MPTVNINSEDTIVMLLQSLKHFVGNDVIFSIVGNSSNPLFEKHPSPTDSTLSIFINLKLLQSLNVYAGRDVAFGIIISSHLHSFKNPLSTSVALSNSMHLKEVFLNKSIGIVNKLSFKYCSVILPCKNPSYIL